VTVSVRLSVCHTGGFIRPGHDGGSGQWLCLSVSLSVCHTGGFIRPAMMEALISDCVCLSVCLSVTPEGSLDQPWWRL